MARMVNRKGRGASYVMMCSHYSSRELPASRLLVMQRRQNPLEAKLLMQSSCSMWQNLHTYMDRSRKAAGHQSSLRSWLLSPPLLVSQWLHALCLMVYFFPKHVFIFLSLFASLSDYYIRLLSQTFYLLEIVATITLLTHKSPQPFQHVFISYLLTSSFHAHFLILCYSKLWRERG